MRSDVVLSLLSWWGIFGYGLYEYELMMGGVGKDVDLGRYLEVFW
jgi:hypothetical protein